MSLDSESRGMGPLVGGDDSPQHFIGPVHYSIACIRIPVNVAVDVFQDHNAAVQQHPHGNGDSHKRQGVDGDPQRVKNIHRYKDRDGDVKSNDKNKFEPSDKNPEDSNSQKASQKTQHKDGPDVVFDHPGFIHLDD